METADGVIRLMGVLARQGRIDVAELLLFINCVAWLIFEFEKLPHPHRYS